MTEERHPNLAGAFAPPNRGEGLAGRLQPRPRADAPAPAPEQVQPDSEPDQAPVVRRPRAAAAPTKQAPAAGEGVANTAIYLPQATFDAAQEAIHARRTTYADLAVSAFTAVPKEDVWAYFHPNTQQTGDGMPARTPRQTGGPGIQRQFRFDGAQREWLHAEVATIEAPSLSALVAVVLGMYLHTLEQ